MFIYLENNSALNYGLFRYNLFYYPVCVCGFKCANLFTAFLDCLSNISITEKGHTSKHYNFLNQNLTKVKELKIHCQKL
jgi:hypothetical protein